MQQDTQPASRTSGLAIVSLVLPILGPRIAALFPFPAGFVLALLSFPAAFVLAIVALAQVRRSQGRLKGRGFAIAGLCLSVMLPVLLYPVFARARESARKAVCQSNVEHLARAVQLFVTEKGVYPDAATWCDDLSPYLDSPQDFVCGSARDLKCAYAYNAALSRAPGNAIAPDIVTVFESDAGWNASGSPQEMRPARPRHLGGDVFGYADGSARWQSRRESPAPAPAARSTATGTTPTSPKSQ